MSNPLTAKQQAETYARIEAMSEKELSEELDRLETGFTTDRFKAICNDWLEKIKREGKR